jgi:hypothetical protein
MTEQGGFTSTEEAGDDGDGKFGERLHGSPGSVVKWTDG